MAKKSYAEMKELRTSQKSDAKQAAKDFKKFCKEHKLDPESTEAPADEKLAKKWNKVKSAKDKAEAALADTEKWLEENKEKKESKPRPSKYEYPAEVVTAADKKKYRAKMRAAAKKKEKGETPKESKKAAEAKADKKSKKDKKAAKKAKKAETAPTED